MKIQQTEVAAHSYRQHFQYKVLLLIYPLVFLIVVILYNVIIVFLQLDR